MTTLRGLTIGVIGAGTMGQALLRGLLATGVPARALRAADADAGMRRQVQRLRIRVVADNAALVKASDVVILAVKPQQLAAVAARIRPRLSSRHLVVSIAAGIPLRWLQTHLGTTALIRVMPNLPATVGAGFAAVAPHRMTSARQRAIARAIFGAVGDVVELPERDFDAVTAVSGSGPAYVFFLVQAWEQAAAALGLPKAAAARAIRRTLAGSVKLLEASGEPADVLIRKVASKGGTTEAALRVLARRRTATGLAEAVRAAARRSRALSY